MTTPPLIYSPLIPGAAQLLPGGGGPPSPTGQIKVWTGSSWGAKPVKYWNGSSWVVKPVKYWNGSSWVTTTY